MGQLKPLFRCTLEGENKQFLDKVLYIIFLSLNGFYFFFRIDDAHGTYINQDKHKCLVNNKNWIMFTIR